MAIQVASNIQFSCVSPQKHFLLYALRRTKNIMAEDTNNYPRLSLACNKVNPGLTSSGPG